MENLKMPVKKVLLNKIDYTDVGAYYDSIAGVNMLSFKKHGVNIPYVTATFHGTKTCSDQGTAQAIAMQLSALCPCTNCDWTYSVTIVKKVQLPGVNNIETNYNRKSYSGVVNKITCTGGYIDDQWLLQAEDDIITQITQDTGAMNSNPDPITGGGACVKTIREYKFAAAYNAAAYSLNITNYTTGVTTNIAALGATNVLTAAAINATTAITGVICLAVNTLSNVFGAETEFLVQSATPGQLFTIADGGGASTITINYRRIVFIGKTSRTQFAVQYEFGGLQSQPVVPQLLYKKSQWVIDASAPVATANSGVTFVANGTAYNAASAASAAAMVIAINSTSTLGVNHGYATVIGTNIYINGDDSLSTLYMICSLSPGNYTIYTVATPFILLACTFDQWGNVLTGILPHTPHGSFPIMLGENVFRLLALNTDPGSIPFQNDERPDPSVDYCCYFFRTSSSVPPASGGASDRLLNEQIIEVYIKKSLVTTSFVLANANAVLSGQVGSPVNTAPTAAANIALEALLQFWAGAAVTAATGAMAGGLNPNAWTN